MKDLTGVFVTDGVSRSGERFTIPALEDILWQSFGKGTPTSISHDIHRPLGVSRVSSLYVSHEQAYVLGKMFLPETQKEYDAVMRARTGYLNQLMIERVNLFSSPFYAELEKKGLLVQEGQLISNGIVMYGAEGIVRKAFPFMTPDFFDRDGLVYLSSIRKHFDYKGCGVFAAKKSHLALLLHPYLRRSLSRYNSFNTGFIDMLLKADSVDTPVRLRIDDSFIGYAPSFVTNIEFEFWYGPAYSDDIISIPEGLSKYVPDEVEMFYNPVSKTEFVWENKDGKRQFEMEEVAEEEAPMQPGMYGCRYLHSFYDPATGIFDHFDGAIRTYDSDLIKERRDKQMTEMGHRANYTKVFRIDGKLPICTWKSLITQYLKDNMDVYRYFGEEVSFRSVSTQELAAKDPLAKYVPFVLFPGDGIRLQVSYQEPIKERHTRFFCNLDTVTLLSGKTDATDIMVIDLAKCLKANGAAIDYPNCKFMDTQDGFSNLPVIAHNSDDNHTAVNSTLEGLKSFISEICKKGCSKCLSMGLSWNVGGDRSVVISFMGAVPDLHKWMSSFSAIPISRADLKQWLAKQVEYIHGNGTDDASPINASYIQSDGTFFQKRRLVQEDVTLKEVKIVEGRVLAAMDFPDDKEDLKTAIETGSIGYTQLAVVGDMVCQKTGKDYLESPFIAAFGETTRIIQRLANLSFVWCRTH